MTAAEALARELVSTLALATRRGRLAGRWSSYAPEHRERWRAATARRKASRRRRLKRKGDWQRRYNLRPEAKRLRLARNRRYATDPRSVELRRQRQRRYRSKPKAKALSARWIRQKRAASATSTAGGTS